MTGQVKLCQMLMDRLYESVVTRETLLAEQKHLYCGETFSLRSKQTSGVCAYNSLVSWSKAGEPSV